jgi:signal transduction histidine kinase
LIISDNGKGFDTTIQTHRNGVANIKERVKRWQGTINVQSGIGNGATINVKLPLSGITQKRD